MCYCAAAERNERQNNKKYSRDFLQGEDAESSEWLLVKDRIKKDKIVFTVELCFLCPTSHFQFHGRPALTSL
ncbi:hypothetical protein SRHO_G00015870 [Serrasalmus rhombeus]